MSESLNEASRPAHGFLVPLPSHTVERSEPSAASLRRLVVLSRGVSGDLDLDRTLSSICRGVVEGLGFGVAVVNLVLPDGGLLVDYRLLDHDDTVPVWLPQGPLPGGGGPGQPWDPRDGLLAPLRTARSGLLGVLSVDLPDDGCRPGADQLTLLEAYAEQASVALENAALHTRLVEHGAARDTALLQLTALVDNAPMAIVEHDMAGIVRRWNGAAERIFGWTAAEVIGQPLPVLPPDELQDRLGELTANGPTRRREARIGVNLSPLQLQPGLADTVRSVLAATGLAPEALTLELTEDVVPEDVDGAVRVLRELRSLGVTVAIDDFGAGYSSLGYLKQLPVQVVKIDRSLVQGVDRDPAARALLDAVVTLIARLGMTAVAEGAETVEQGDLLEQLGCPIAQGFLLALPMREADASRLLSVGVPSSPAVRRA